MLSNPFSPIFGGKPDMFFGREEYIRRFDLAMVDRGSDDRVLFFTGTRGSGKTALLERLSMRAAAKDKRVIDLGPEDTISQLILALAGSDEVTKTISPQASINVLGVGGGVSAGAISKTQHFGREHLQSLLLSACEKAPHGIFVTVDEIQKVPLDDVSSLCNAFQMASRKGHDIMLAVAGLPFSYSEIVEHEGCTYLRRAAHEELGLFSWNEVSDALQSAFSRIKGLKVGMAQIDLLNQASYGHPYLMQLLGFHLVSYLNEGEPRKSVEASTNDVNEAIKRATLAYELRALKPLVDGLPELELSYLRAMSECLDKERLASTGEIADSLGMEQRGLSKARARLIGDGIIAAPERGKVMFCVPYLAAYMQKEAPLSNAVERARQRRV